MLNHIKVNISTFTIQVLPSGKYFSSVLTTAVEVIFISMFISVIENRIFFMDVNSDVGKKVDLTWLALTCWKKTLLFVKEKIGVSVTPDSSKTNNRLKNKDSIIVMTRQDYEQRIRVKEELKDINLGLREKCPYLSVFTPNAGKYGPENRWIRTLFMQCDTPIMF